MGLTVTDDSMTKQTHTVVTINMDDVGMTAVWELASGVVLVIDRSSVDKDQRLLTSARLETAENMEGNKRKRGRGVLERQRRARIS